RQKRVVCVHEAQQDPRGEWRRGRGPRCRGWASPAPGRDGGPPKGGARVRGEARAGVQGSLSVPPAMAGRVFIGTSGYVYAHWRGRFYPAHLPVGRWFGHYAAHFSTVELNRPFYQLPAASTFAAWRRAAPRRFVLAVHASRYPTPMKKLKDPRPPPRPPPRRARAPRPPPRPLA